MKKTICFYCSKEHITSKKSKDYIKLLYEDDEDETILCLKCVTLFEEEKVMKLLNMKDIQKY